ncbi:MAG: hypothetical protein QXX95_02990 [Nitrososphaerales archaeon]
MNDVIDKIKTAFFGKEGEKKPPTMAIVLGIGVIGLLIYNNVFKEDRDVKVKDTPAVSSDSPQGLGSLIGEENYQKIKASELKEVSGDTGENKGKADINKENNTVKQGNNIQTIQSTQIPPPPPNIATLDERLKMEDMLRQKKELEIEKMKSEMEEKKKEELLKRKVALSYIGYSVSYPDEGKQENNIKQEALGEEKKVSSYSKDLKDNFLITTRGELLDDIKLRVGANKTVRIKLENGDILVVKAFATNTGIAFDNKGILNGESVSVQIEDSEGNMEMVSYVIDNSSKRISKSAFLSFIKGFSEGMINRTQQTSALGTTTEFTSSGVQTGLSKGVAGATDSLIQESQKNIIPDVMVLLAGERLKVMILKTKEV